MNKLNLPSKKYLLNLTLPFILVSVNLVSADTGDYGWMGQMMYGPSGSGMMGGIFGGLMYLLIIVNLILLAIFLYKKVRNMK